MAPRIQFHDHPSAHASDPNLTDIARTNQDIDVIEGSPVEYRHQRLNLYLSPIETSGACEDGDGFDVLGVGEQVHGRQALKAVASASEMLKIAHLRVWVATDVDDASRCE